MSYIGNDLATDQIFLPDGVGAISRTIPSKLKDIVSVKDFGAVGDGVADDTAAIQAALDATQAISFPAGTYKVTSTLLVKNHNKVVYGNNSVIAYTGTGWVINAQLVGGTLFPQYLQLNDLYIASGPNATGGIYWRFSYGTAKNISVQIPVTNQIAWQIGCDSAATGAYYNQFQNCNVQVYVGITAGVANQKGWVFEVVAVSGIAPNTNTFVGGRTSQTKIAWSISGLNNRLIGPTVEGTESGGTCFVIANAIQPLACGYNHITSPYVEGLAGANAFSIASGYYNAIVYPFVTSTGGGTVFSDTAVGTTLLNESGYRFPNYRSPDSQTLDAYKEGTWTPSLFALGGGTASYAYAGGTYTQIGNRILFDGYIGLSSVGTLSGAVKLVLPFQASSTNIFSAIAFARTSAISGGYPVLGGEITASATRAYLILSNVTGSSTGVLQASQLANSSEFSFSGHYII